MLSRYDKSYARGEDFPVLKAKIEAGRDASSGHSGVAPPGRVSDAGRATEQDMANDTFRKRGWVNRSVTAAIDEISSKHAFLGGYFRKAFRTKNLRFVLDVGSKWNVVRGKGLTEFSTGVE